MTRLTHAIAGVLCLAGLLPAAYGGELRLASEPGQLRASQPDGTLCWTVRFGDRDVAGIVRRSGNTIELTNGVLVDDSGQIVWRQKSSRLFAADDDAWLDSRAAAWDPLTTLFAPPGMPLPHVFDANGNACVILPAGSSSALKVRWSSGHTGTWGATTTVPVGTSDIFSPSLAVDANDAMIVVFRSGYYGLRYIRYVPGIGWGACHHSITRPRSSR